MIAYNYFIKFIPELKHDKKVEGSFADMIEVIECPPVNFQKKMKQEMPFYNNQGRKISLYTDREFDRTVKGQLWVFEIKGVVTFFWHSGSLTIKYFQQESFTQDLLEYWCLHIVLPIFFTVEETYDFLHAGGVEIEGESVLFMAESFGGKSTMTDYFMKHGHAMISDDKVASIEKEGKFYAIPSHPHQRPYRKMEDLGYFIDNFSKEPSPIHAIYQLEKADSDAMIKIKELNGIEKFKSLRYASETNLFFLKPKRFEYLMEMANSVPVYKVNVPWDLKRLEEVYKAIIIHCKT